MASRTLISVEEYLRTSYKPNCHYVDGVLHQKPWPTWMNGLLQARVCYLIAASYPEFEAACEVTLQISAAKWQRPSEVQADVALTADGISISLADVMSVL